MLKNIGREMRSSPTNRGSRRPSDVNGAEPTPEQGAGDREMSRILDQALDGLPEEYREVILLRDVESLTAPEAAESILPIRIRYTTSTSRPARIPCFVGCAR